MAVAKAIEVFLLEYGMNRNDLNKLQKNYTRTREWAHFKISSCHYMLTNNRSSNRMWLKQKENTRLTFIKRAQLYHSGRVNMHALYRRRSVLDDHLLGSLVELCLSPYTRVRRYVGFYFICRHFDQWNCRQSQSILHSIFGVGLLNSTIEIYSPFCYSTTYDPRSLLCPLSWTHWQKEPTQTEWKALFMFYGIKVQVWDFSCLHHYHYWILAPAVYALAGKWCCKVYGLPQTDFCPLSDLTFHGRYLVSLLECQHEEKVILGRLSI